MKKDRLYSLLFLLAGASVMQAQTTYEAANLLNEDLSGTARFVGMGGAMSALGADISTMGVNPAGTGLYRSWDMNVSFGGNSVANRSVFNGTANRASKFYGSFDNVGTVIPFKMSNSKPLRFINFGFNFRNVKRFNQNMAMLGDLNGLSQTSQMAHQAFQNEVIGDDYFDPDKEISFDKNNYYGDNAFGWLTLLGVDAGLIDQTALYEDFNGESYPGGHYYPSDYAEYSSREDGGIHAYDFNLSFNVLDRAYFGLTLTNYDVDRYEESVYKERFADGNYQLQNFYRTKGWGLDLKLGAIVRPFSESSFRIGLSAATPTLYRMTDYNSAIISSTINYTEGPVDRVMDTMDKNAFGKDCFTDYTVVTPGKVNVSLGGTIGTSLALGAEYEYANYAFTKLIYDDGQDNEVVNRHTESILNGHHTVRVGLEKVFLQCLSLRLGYNYVTGGYKKDAWKMIPVNSVQTNTAYTNIRDTHNISVGLGYRGDMFYADLAGLFSLRNADFYPFENVQLQATRVTQQRFKGMLTLGMRF